MMLMMVDGGRGEYMVAAATMMITMLGMRVSRKNQKSEFGTQLTPLVFLG